MSPELNNLDGGEAGDRTTETATPRRHFLAGAAGVAAFAGLPGAGLASGAASGAAGRSDRYDETTFTVRIENVSKSDALETSANGEARTQAVPISPGAYAVHSEPAPMFAAGESARDNGLEALAEDGMPDELASSVAERDDVSDSGAFAVPVGADEFSVAAAPGDRLSFATMFVQSNDLFYAPDERRVALFDGEDPLDGDVTVAVGLWDAGTECNQEPGAGDDQAPRQSEAGTGMTEDRSVRLVSDVGDGYSYPYIPEVIRVTRAPGTE